MKYWEDGDFKGSKLGMTAKFVPTCPFHTNIGMILKNCKALHFSLRGDDDWDSHALDVVMTCPECGYIDLFGVAISEEYHTKITEMVDHDRERDFGLHTNIIRRQADDGNTDDNEWMDVYG